MGVDLAVGRPFVEGEGTAVAVISDAFWTRSFGRTPDILAKTIDLNGVAFDVIGVGPRRFAGHSVGHSTDVWIPLAMRAALVADGPDLLDERPTAGGRWLKVIGRLGAGVEPRTRRRVGQPGAPATRRRQGRGARSRPPRRRAGTEAGRLAPAGDDGLCAGTAAVRAAAHGAVRGDRPRAARRLRELHEPDARALGRTLA